MSMTLIESKTLGTAQASIEFTSIPQTFTDLIAVVSVRNNSNVTGMFVRFNSDSGANYSWRRLQGDGNAATSDSNATYGSPYNTGFYLSHSSISTNTANTFGNLMMTVPNYTAAVNKSISGDGVSENNGQAFQAIAAGLWSSTAAITSMTFTYDGGGNFAIGSTISLYGVGQDSRSSQAKATGGTIYRSGDFWVHEFTSSGTFTPTSNITCEYLVIAGGGGGGEGGFVNGGGGAGGYRTGTGSFLAATNYTVTVGGGGARNAAGAASSIFGIESAGGGRGATSGAGGSGGSGGGGSTSGGGGGAGNTPTTTPSQGNNGGNGATNGGAGGGGAGGGGGFASTGNGGWGGAGVESAITGATVARAGGGGGSGNSSSGGATAGGGAGGQNNGVANTGGGGGGQSPAGGGGGNGGSGIVIVRYAA